MLMHPTVSVRVQPRRGAPALWEIPVTALACARNTSRDSSGTAASLQAWRDRGYQVHAGASVCRKSRFLVTTENRIEVQGPYTSGEVEFVVLRARGEFLITAGSDHNDRSLGELWSPGLGRVFDSSKAKQMVPAVLAPDAWLYADVREHWDRLVLRSAVTVDGNRIPYQEFSLAEVLDLEHYRSSVPWLEQDGGILLGGSAAMLPSVPANVYAFQALSELPGTIDDLFFPADFHFELEDPVLDRRIRHAYSVLALEVPGSRAL